MKETVPTDARPWATSDLTAAGGPVTLTVPYGRGYTSRFVFDPARARYRRFVEDRPSVDALTGHQIEVAAVIVLYARWWQVYEGSILTSRMELTGEGRITVFAAGRQVEGTWRRLDASHRTLFADVDGKPLRLPPGRVWISIVPPDRIARVTTEVNASAR